MKIRKITKIDKLILGFFVDLATTLPPVIFTLPTFFLFPTFMTLFLLIIGLIEGSLFFYTICTFEDIKYLKNCINGFLKPFSKCEFIEFQLEDYIFDNLKNFQEKKSFRFAILLQNLRIKIRHDSRIFVIKRGLSESVPSQLVSYETFFNTPSMIFIRDEPDKSSFLNRFFLYHEIGHSSFENNYSRRLSHLGWKFSVITFFWALINLEPGILTYSFLGGFLILLIVSFIFNELFVIPHQRFLEEVSADLFSISCLSNDERTKLKNYLMKIGNLPNDRLLTKEQNMQRFSIILEQIKEFEILKTFDRPINALYSIASGYNLFLLGAYTIFLGFYSRMPTIGSLVMNIISTLSLFFIMISFELKKKLLTIECQNIISGNI